MPVTRDQVQGSSTAQQADARGGNSVCIAFASGCPRAEVDTALLFEYFAENGWTIVSSVADADTVVVTTCGVDLEHEGQSYRLLDAVDRERRTDSTMVVVGCAAGILHSELRARYDAVVLAPRDLASLDGVIGAGVGLDRVEDPSPIGPLLSRAKGSIGQLDLRAGDSALKRFAHTAAKAVGVGSEQPTTGADRIWTIRVGRGCRGECTFCAIRAACGPLRSKPLEKVFAEFERGRAAGFDQFGLVAQDLGAYGADIGSNVVELLTALFGQPGESRFSVVDIGANWFLEYSDELIDLLSGNTHRIRRLVVPIQSGSDRILGLMRRGHTASQALETFKAARQALPNVEFSTHALVGFPGETEEDFQATMDFLREVGFDHVDVWDYTDRPGTPATNMPDKVSTRDIRSRSRRIRSEFHGPGAALEYRARTWFAGR